MNDDVVRVEPPDIARTELAQRAELVLPAVIVDAGPAAVERFLEFFAARIANRRTRAAYGRAVGQFLAWCEARGLALEAVSPLHVAAYIRTHPGSAPTVKQHLAAIRMLADWLVVSQVLPVNPAAAVRGPKHVVTTGATPVLSPAEARRLLAAIDTGTLAGLRDRALVSVMLYSVARVSAVRRAGHQVLEVNRGDRRTSRIAGKSDTVDAETAARSVLAGQSTAIPKTADGAVEMMRHLKVARLTAVKARTSAMITLKQIGVTAPPELRETLHPLADQALLKRCRGWRCGTIDTPTASAKYTLRALARRWFALSVEIVDHDRHLGRLTTQTSPTLREGFGIGADTAAEMLIIFGDNPDGFILKPPSPSCAGPAPSRLRPG